MRTKDEALSTCPTCGADNTDIGLRNFTWLFDVLPGRVAATDLDCIIEQHKTGRILCIEFKPSFYVPRGQSLLFDALIHQGWDVWVVVDKDLAKDRVGLQSWPLVGPPKWMTVAELKKTVAAWWAAG